MKKPLGKASITVIDIIPHKKGEHMEKLAKSLKIPFGGMDSGSGKEDMDPDTSLDSIFGEGKEDKDLAKLTLADASINQLKAALKKKMDEEKSEGENPDEEADESGEEEMAEHEGDEEESTSKYG